VDNSSSSSPEPDRLPQSSQPPTPTPSPSREKQPQTPSRTSRPYADPSDELRASDADRERVAEALRDAYAEGRLDADEHAQRLEAAYASKTLGELVPLTKDLPAASRPHPAPTTAPAPVSDLDTEAPDKVVAVFGGAQRKGRFRVRRALKAVAVFGGIEIDLSEALLEGHEYVIQAWTVFGGIDITVPPSVTLRGGGAAVFGGFDIREEEAESAGGPVVTIRGGAVFGGVSARRKKLKKKQLSA
jgi:hypothetical protein